MQKHLSELKHIFAGHTVHVVGGAVRDRLLGRPTLDIDLILPGHPEPFVRKIVNTLGGSAFDLDKERGIVRVSLKSGVQLDFAQWQGKTLDQDLARRDFTVNALAVAFDDWLKPSWSKKIIDRYDGVTALKQKKIVALSPTVFNDDPLRLLRAFRLAAELDFSIDTKTLTHIKRDRKRLTKAAPERIREELLKTFETPNAHAQLVAMENAGLLEIFFKEAIALRKTAPRHYGKGGVLKHTLDSVMHFEKILASLRSWFPWAHKKIDSYLQETYAGYSRRAHGKWALLLHDIGKPATQEFRDGRLRFFEHEHVGADAVMKLSARFRWSGEETSRYARLVRNHMRPGNLAAHGEVTDKAIHRFFRDLEQDAISMLLVSLADHLTYLTSKQLKRRNSPHERTTIKMIRAFYRQRTKVIPPKILNGYDIMKAFKLKPSPLIGELLNELKEAQSEGKIHTKEDGLAFLKTRI